MDEEIAWTLPWGQEVLQRLRTAHRNTREGFERAPRTRDVHEGTEIANFWPFVTGCYSGIEQSFKVVIAGQRGLTVKQLLKETRRKYLTHDLGCLFAEVDDDARRTLNEYYERFHSLHDDIDVSSLQQFLSDLSEPHGSGYERWRYSLVETEREMPSNRVKCMLSIWGATVELIESRQYPDKGRNVTMPDDELRDALHASFHDASDDDKRALSEFVCPYENALSAVATLLWRDHRGICPEADGSDWLSRFFRRTLSAIADERNRSSVSMFINRAIGKGASGLSVRWNDKTHRFEDVPWNLRYRVIDEVPRGAQKFIPEKYDDLLRIVYQGGFLVRENLGGVATDPKWSCTLVAEKERVSGEMLMLKIWEQKLAPYLHIELEGDDAWRTTSIQELVDRSFWQQRSLSMG